MKKNSKFVLLFAVIVIALIGFALQKFGEPSTLYLRGNVRIADDLKSSVGQPQTLFITVFDAAAPGGRPLAVYQERLGGAVSSDHFSFVLTPQTLQFMGQFAGGEGGGQTLPQQLFVKARIDQDGLGGPDQVGDLVGFIENVALGADDVELIVNTKI